MQPQRLVPQLFLLIGFYLLFLRTHLHTLGRIGYSEKSESELVTTKAMNAESQNKAICMRFPRDRNPVSEFFKTLSQTNKTKLRLSVVFCLLAT